jgi:hypothetical protein
MTDATLSSKERLIDFLQYWIDIDRLQNYEDRERFRREAGLVAAGLTFEVTPPETRAFPQAPDTDERYNVSDGLLETLIEVAQDNGFRDVVEALRELQVRRGSRTVNGDV